MAEGDTKPLPRRRASKKGANSAGATRTNGVGARHVAEEATSDVSETIALNFNIDDDTIAPTRGMDMTTAKEEVEAIDALKDNVNDTPAQKQENAARRTALVQALTALRTPAPEPTNDELMDMARRQRRINAGLGVLASIVGGLWSLYKVLSDPDFQNLLANDLNPSVKNAMTGALSKVLEKLDPYFSGLRKFQEKGLRDNTNRLFDASVDIAYAIVELNEPDEQEAARKRAESLALTMGMVKEGMPLVLAAADIVQKCVEALACKESHKTFEGAQTKAIGETLQAALELRTKEREAIYTRNVEKGYVLLAEQSA